MFHLNNKKAVFAAMKKPPEGGCGLEALEADYFFSFLTSFKNFLKSLPIG